ncbi:MAG: two-component sensor histidine kinase, partial [Myxococcota bacterium]
MPPTPLSTAVRIRTLVVAVAAMEACLWLAPTSNVHLGALPALCVAVVLCASWILATRLPSIASGMLVAASATVCLLVLLQAGSAGVLWSPVIFVPILIARFTAGQRMALWSSVGVASMFFIGLYLSSEPYEALRVGTAGGLWLALNVLSTAPGDAGTIALPSTPSPVAASVEPVSVNATGDGTTNDVAVQHVALTRGTLQQAARSIHQLVGSILTSVDLISDEVAEYGDVGQDLNELRRSAHRASELAVRLMVVARNQSPDPEEVDLATHLQALLPEISGALGPHVKLELSVLPGIPPLYMDEGQLTDALREIVRNASEAMGPQGRVRLGAFIDETVPAGCVRLVVEDTGPGMISEIQEQVFHPFFSTRGRGESSGLGLTVVHAIVTQAGGRVMVESELGVGTRVIMDLPSVAAHNLDGIGVAGGGIVVGGDNSEAAIVAQLLRDRGQFVRFANDAPGG